MDNKILFFMLVAGLAAGASAITMSKCDLARRLKLHGAPNYAEWTCIADVNTNGLFDTNWKNGDRYGLWEISASEWCRDEIYVDAPNRCNFDCKRFQDGFLTDDLRCLREIFAERNFYGFPGWFRRYLKCPNIDTYLRECNL